MYWMKNGFMNSLKFVMHISCIQWLSLTMYAMKKKQEKRICIYYPWLGLIIVYFKTMHCITIALQPFWQNTDQTSTLKRHCISWFDLGLSIDNVVVETELVIMGMGWIYCKMTGGIFTLKLCSCLYVYTIIINDDMWCYILWLMNGGCTIWCLIHVFSITTLGELVSLIKKNLWIRSFIQNIYRTYTSMFCIEKIE